MNLRDEIEAAIDDYGISSELIGSERCRHAPLSTAKAMITRDRAALIALIFDTTEPVVITEPDDFNRAALSAAILIRDMWSNEGDEAISEQLNEASNNAAKAGWWDEDWDWENVCDLLEHLRYVNTYGAEEDQSDITEPVVITDTEIEAGATAAYEVLDGIYGRDHWTDIGAMDEARIVSRAILEAAARSRATGSGVGE